METGNVTLNLEKCPQYLNLKYRVEILEHFIYEHFKDVLKSEWSAGSSCAALLDWQTKRDIENERTEELLHLRATATKLGLQIIDPKVEKVISLDPIAVSYEASRRMGFPDTGLTQVLRDSYHNDPIPGSKTGPYEPI